MSNSLDQDQNRHSVGLHLGSNCLEKAIDRRQNYPLTCKELRCLSTLWPILQLIAHHIQDKLAVSFDSSSIGLISYKCFLTIDAKYSSVKAYNEENSIF